MKKFFLGFISGLLARAPAINLLKKEGKLNKQEKKKGFLKIEEQLLRLVMAVAHTLQHLQCIFTRKQQHLGNRNKKKSEGNVDI